MQGQRRSLTTLPESLSFDHAAMSGDTSIESQMTWSSLQTSAQNRLEEIRLSTNGTNVPYLRHVRIGMPNAQWSSGETSSAAAQNHVNGNLGKIEQHSRTFQSRSGLNVISVENDEVDLNGSQAPTGPFVLPNSGSDAISQDLNMIFGDDDEDPTGPFVLPNSGSDAISQDLNMIFGDDDEDDDCQIVERPSTYVSLGSSNVLGNEDRPGCSSDGKRAACKRKAFEVEGGQTSGGGSSSSSKNAERRCHWRPISTKAIELEIGKSSGGGSSSSSKNAERCHWRPISTKSTEVQVGQSSGGGSSSSSKNAERCHWRPIPTKAVGVQVGQSSGVGGSSSSQNAERCNWGPMPAKAVEVQVGQSSRVGGSNSSQNEVRCHWVPMSSKAAEVQVGQSSAVGGSNSSQNPERSHWVPVPAKDFEVQVGQSSGVESSNSSQNAERSNWVREPAKAIEVQVGQCSGVGSSNSSQNEVRRHWVPIPEKALGVQVGQSSGAGSSSSSQNAERCRWVPIPAAAFQVQFGQSSGLGSSNSSQNEERCQVPIPADHMASRNVTLPTQNEPVSRNSSEHANPRLRLGVGGAVSEGPFSRTTSGNTESSRRNIRVRINGSSYQDPIVSHPFAAEADVGTRDIPSTRHSARLLRNNVLDLNPVPPLENGGSPHEQYTASLRRNPQTRWSRASSSRTTRSSTPAIPEPTATSIPIPRSISEHPIFVPAATEIGSSDHPTGWNVANGNNTTAENVVSASAAGSSTGVNLSSAAWSHRSRLERPRRLSEIVRRSALLSAGSDSGSQGPSPAIGSSSSLTPEEMALLSGSHLHDRVATSSRSALLERNLDLPYSLRNLATASEGRSSSIMSEIRHVLNLMRRGEGLRFEDVMLLDQSVFAGMADMHDRHRDMRLDVDNMSYEELLALEERIGNVCTGLNVETIMNGLKQRKYAENGTKDQVDTEPCSICREEYNNGEDLGTLECGHDFHRDCIKQWLVQKNSCPICKKTGLST